MRVQNKKREIDKGVERKNIKLREKRLRTSSWRRKGEWLSFRVDRGVQGRRHM